MSILTKHTNFQKKMKTIILSACALAITLVSCGEEKSETVIIERDTQSTPAPAAEEDEGNSISFDVNRDDNGEVDAGVSGDIDLKKK